MLGYRGLSQGVWGGVWGLIVIMRVILGLSGKGFGVVLGGYFCGLEVGHVGFMDWGDGFWGSEGCVRVWGLRLGGWGSVWVLWGLVRTGFGLVREGFWVGE